AEEPDATPLAISISSAKDTLIAAEVAHVTFTFSRAPNSFGLQDIIVSGGELSSLDQVSSNVWTAVFTPSSESEVLGRIQISAGSVVGEGDGQGNLDASFEFTIDTRLPLVTITSDQVYLTAGG